MFAFLPLAFYFTVIMKYFFILLLATGAGSLYAQDAVRSTSIPGKDTVLPKTPLQRMVPRNGMPNLFIIKPDQPLYKGNNGKGSDIYESRIDKMPLLVPDSSFSSSMPNAIQPLQPRMDTLQELINKRKQWNDRYRIPR